MKPRRIEETLARIVAHHAAPPIEGTPVPSVPRRRLWNVIRPRLPQVVNATPRTPMESLARLAGWLGLVQQPLRWGCPLPIESILSRIDGLLPRLAVAESLRDAPAQASRRDGPAMRCRALAREARQHPHPTHESLAVVLDNCAAIMEAQAPSLPPRTQAPHAAMRRDSSPSPGAPTG
ncbi:MAG: hypothetical protein WCR07_17185 [Verrucomicrobiota bacterium]